MPSRRPPDTQIDLFVPYVADLPLRDQRETMERPFFSLAKRKRLKPIEYTGPNGEVFVNVFPNPEFGMATIWDADILIWAASVLNDRRRRGENDLPRTLSFHPYDLLKTIGRETGGREYRLLREALGRLQSTSIVTNIRVKRGKKHRQFSWIESWTDLVDEDGKQSRGMSLTLSDWFYEGLLMEGSLLSIDPVYFSISGGRERWLYRVARKHAGGAGEGGFAIALPTLFEKSGAEGTYRRFKFEMQAIVRRNNVPGFHLSLETGRGEPVLRMVRAEPTGNGDAAMPVARKPHNVVRPSSSAAPVPLPLFGHRALSATTIERIRHDFPGWDIYALQAAFDAWLSDGRRDPKDYEAAFYGFVRQHHARNHG
jgi:plasmid replication initiation protein